MAFKGQELKNLIGTPVGLFTLNAGEGAGAGTHYKSAASYDPQAAVSAPASNGPSEPAPS